MTPPAAGTPAPAVRYPSSDGKPIAENTRQFEWIVTVKGNLDLLYADRPDVFVAGDNLIYPVRGDNKTRQAPDVYVAFGRPKGHRGSYQVWAEGGIFPQVVFEVLSPGNRAKELARKLAFYQRYGAEEYYVLDPDRIRMKGYRAGPAGFDPVPDMNGWASPRLGIRFGLGADLEVYYPDGRPFLTFVQLGERHQEAVRQAEAAQRAADAARRAADAARRTADIAQQAVVTAQQAVATARQRADAERDRADKLAAKLRALGLDPDAG
ncbi:MAG: Uma2 family endonuclease [Gemmataceae bacterium]|nr:Uma2 family endonuclease [Gemmataceae bacterium]